MEEISENSKSIAYPFFLRVSAIFILVTGVIGALFYLFAALFRLSGQDYLYNIDYKGFSGASFYLMLTMQIALNIGLVISSVLLLNLKKSGIYIFASTFVVISLMNFLLQGDKSIVIPVIGLVLIVVIFLHKGRMT
jgi:hypothetical protein